MITADRLAPPVQREIDALERVRVYNHYRAITHESIPQACASLACAEAMDMADDIAFDAAIEGLSDPEAAILTAQRIATMCGSCTTERIVTLRPYIEASDR